MEMRLRSRLQKSEWPGRLPVRFGRRVVRRIVQYAGRSL
jgi:hypothetical protein